MNIDPEIKIEIGELEPENDPVEKNPWEVDQDLQYEPMSMAAEMEEENKFSLHVERVIKYRAAEEENAPKVLIYGQFNSWIPEVMEKHSREEIMKNPALDKEFFYRARLLTGYMYRYYFSVNDQEDFSYDKTQPTGKNRFGRMCNVLTVGEDKLVLGKMLSYSPEVIKGLTEEEMLPIGRIVEC